MRGVANATLWPLYPLERDPVPIVQEAGWAAGPVWTGAENLALTGIRSPDRPARSESLYRLSYPGPSLCNGYANKCRGSALHYSLIILPQTLVCPTARS